MPRAMQHRANATGLPIHYTVLPLTRPEPPTMPVISMRLLDPVRHAMPEHAARPAIAGRSLRLSHAELDALISRASAAFRRLGLEGARVGVLLPNVAVFPVVVFGLLRGGARVVMMNAQYSPREIREIVEDSRAAAVVTLRALVPLLPAGTRPVLADDLPAAITVEGATGSARLELGEPSQPTASTADPDEEAIVLYTGASSGTARGARLSHANLTSNLRATIEAMRLGPEDRVLALLPLVHLFGFTVTQNAALAAGACIVPVERFNPLRTLELVEREGITVICGVPGIYRALLAAAERGGAPRHALRVAICGGSPLPTEVARRWQALFAIPLRQGYGLTEAGPVCLFNRVDRPNRAGSLGYPFPGVDVSIRDAAGVELPRGEVGEICVRGPGVFLGYVGEDGRGPSDFHGQWLRTGDLGAEIPDGTVRYHGLIKPMFTRNGYNVYPREIERVLAEDPRVANATVCSLPDPLRESEIVVLITPRPNSTLTEEAVRERCLATLAAYKQPGRIVIRPTDNRRQTTDI
jgi:long-chain acyl-CoA synthetase